VGHDTATTTGARAEPVRRRPAEGRAPDAGLSEHARRNWNADADPYQARHGQQLAGDGKAWGTWDLPESELHVLGEVAGRDILELGCGAAQGSIDLARAGARPIGLDWPTPASTSCSATTVR
jgi:hypothetical protein